MPCDQPQPREQASLPGLLRKAQLPYPSPLLSLFLIFFSPFVLFGFLCSSLTDTIGRGPREEKYTNSFGYVPPDTHCIIKRNLTPSLEKNDRFYQNGDNFLT